MEKTKYRDLIMRYLTALDPNQVITTEQVAQYVAEQLQLETATVKKTVNVNMARLEKEGQIVRLTKGIYCRKVKTAFGYYTPDKETLFCKQLLRNENEVIGYETGLSALNRIGLVSQMPKKKVHCNKLAHEKDSERNADRDSETANYSQCRQLSISANFGCNSRTGYGTRRYSEAG